MENEREIMQYFKAAVAAADEVMLLVCRAKHFSCIIPPFYECHSILQAVDRELKMVGNKLLGKSQLKAGRSQKEKKA